MEQNTATPSATAGESYRQFIEENPGRGTLRVQVSTARGTFPVPGAQVEVSRVFNSVRRILYSRMTDLSGIAGAMALPAQATGASLNELTAGTSGTVYQVSVYHAGYLPLRLSNVEIYNGIETILPVALEPMVR
ncbi:MAG: hypothetical protein IJT78_01380 [Oscillospiraceae bacterium]|nr:hypothetical protein [Oscillospiraceae bacterium]